MSFLNKEFFDKFLKINSALALLTVGLYFFLLPSKLLVGGISGLSVVLTEYFPNIPTGIIMLGINLILLVLGFLLIGKEFGGYTIYCSVMTSFLIYILEKFVPMEKPLVDDLLINLVFGIVITAIGIGIIFYQNASTGGTDIIAKIMNKYTGLEVGKCLMAADFLIIVAATFTFGVRNGLYAFMGMFINGFVIDYIIAGFNKKVNMYINSEKYKEINDFIIKEIDRGTTLYFAEGGYSGKQRVVINSIVSKKEYLKIRQFANNIDQNVFMTINYVSEVHGEGFSKFSHKTN